MSEVTSPPDSSRGKWLVVVLLGLGLASGIILTYWRTMAGYVLIEFHTESTVSHRMVAVFSDPDGDGERTEPASPVWTVSVRDGAVTALEPADGAEPIWEGPLAAPPGFPEPDAAFASRPGFVRFDESVEVSMRAINHDGSKITVDDPELYAHLDESRKAEEAVRIHLRGGTVIRILAATEDRRRTKRLK